MCVCVCVCVCVIFIHRWGTMLWPLFTLEGEWDDAEWFYYCFHQAMARGIHAWFLDSCLVCHNVSTELQCLGLLALLMVPSFFPGFLHPLFFFEGWQDAVRHRFGSRSLRYLSHWRIKCPMTVPFFFFEGWQDAVRHRFGSRSLRYLSHWRIKCPMTVYVSAQTVWPQSSSRSRFYLLIGRVAMQQDCHWGDGGLAMGTLLVLPKVGWL